MNKINIVINNYFSYDIPSPEEISIKEAYKRGFIRGFNKVNPPASPIHAKWTLTPYQNEEDNMNGNYHYECSNCGAGDLPQNMSTYPIAGIAARKWRVINDRIKRIF